MLVCVDLSLSAALIGTMSSAKKRQRSGDSIEEATGTPAASSSSVASPKSSSSSTGGGGATSAVGGSPPQHPNKKLKHGENGVPVPVTTPSKLTRATSLTPASPSALMAGASTALTAQAYSASAAAHATKFKQYSAHTAERAHQILHEVFPRKVLELDHLVSTASANSFEHSVTFPFNADGTFIQGRESQPIPSNPSVMALIPTVRQELLTMIDNLGALKLYIQLQIPKVDDGNNFGVEIQEESINELARLEDIQFGYLEKIQGYYATRTRIAAKISKYVSILDYWQSLREVDEAFYTDLRLHLVEMRNSHATVHDLLVKNEEKLKHPRGENEDQGGRNRRHAFA